MLLCMYIVYQEVFVVFVVSCGHNYSSKKLALIKYIWWTEVLNNLV